jgi:tetratricopeptide (TPR) repeat protein
MDAAREFIRREDLADDFKLLYLDDPYIVASLFQADRERLATVLGEGPVNTWQRPRLEFSLAREFRRKPTPYHEDETLLWLQRVREPKPQIVRGDYDDEKLERFYASESKLLEAFASGGGISRLETGVDQLKEGLEINPDDKRMSIYLTSLQIAEEDLEEAFETGRITTPEDLVRVGLLRLDDGRFEEALTLFEEALEMKPEDSSIQYNRLRTLRELERWEVMEEALKRFREEFPRDARGFSMQGRLYANRGEFEKALAEFEEAVERDPGNPVFVNNLATSLARLNRFGEAGQGFAKVCELNPTYPQAAFFAAASFSMANRNEEAAHWVRFCIERGLVEPARFTEDLLFANLRASEHWDPSLLE